jgi:4-carboxymuconolactone decarboxylase
VSDSERAERGEAVGRDLLGREPSPRVGPYAEAVRDFVLAEVWSRTGLPRREKRLITLTCCAMQREEIGLRWQMRAALESAEISVGELREFALHFATYGGFALGAFVDRIITETARELGHEGDAASAAS